MGLLETETFELWMSKIMERFDRHDQMLSKLAGKEISLTPRALMLLEYLMSHADELHTRERLLSTLWGYEFAVTTRAIDHRIAELRRALGEDAQNPRFIETVQSAGYRFLGQVRGS